MSLALCCLATQGMDVSTSDLDVTDIEAVKNKGHREVAAGQVSFRLSAP